MKTPEELNALKEEVEVLNKKLRELTPEELEQVSGGVYQGGMLCICNRERRHRRRYC